MDKAKDWQIKQLKLQSELNHGDEEDTISQRVLANKAFRLNQILRKIAHAGEYIILTFLLILLFRSKHTWNMDIKKAIILAVVICLVYSMTDEIHQLLVPGRSGLLIDCVNDTCSGFVAAAIYYIGYKFKK